MEKWEIVKAKIQECSKRSTPDNNWMDKYDYLLNNVDKLSLTQLHDIQKDLSENMSVRRLAYDLYKILYDHNIREDFNNVVTLKLIMPTKCNANCSFCYHNNASSNSNNVEFIDRFLDSITTLINRIDGAFPISLDITGAEPTYDIDLFRTVMSKLRNYKYKEKLCRIVLTTNGYHMKEVLYDLEGVVNYVNFSVHDYNDEERQNIFGTDTTPMAQEYINMVLALHKIGIDSSAVAVIHKEHEDFKSFMREFIDYCKMIGFKSLRFRKNVYWEDDSVFSKYMNMAMESFDIIQHEDVPDSTWCRLCDDSGFFIFFLSGVDNTYLYSKGIEYVIHRDGKLYLDFNAEIPFNESIYPVKYIFDKK